MAEDNGDKRDSRDRETRDSGVDYFRDPVAFGDLLWPNVRFYDKQREILYSLANNVQTFVPAGNMLGKDFVAAFAVLWFFLTRQPCRIVTTSADYSQLGAVLWGELRNFIYTAKYPLTYDKGGPLVVNHLHIRRMKIKRDERGRCLDELDGLSYILGRVAAKGEGMLGHHIADYGDGVPRTLFVADEASGVDDISYERAKTWAKRILVIGNPFPCSNFFYKGVKRGDVPLTDWRKVDPLGTIAGAPVPDIRDEGARNGSGGE